MRVVVVGGGIVGLATARLIASTRPDAEVVVLEREAELATHQTARNSGVVHAGVYYEPGSLKAQLCRRGVEQLRAFCAERGLPYVMCGKVVVALEERELPRLERLEERARANGVPGLARIDAAGLRSIEPHAAGIAALHSPQTAIADFRAVALALADELRARGGRVRTGAEVVRVRRTGAAARETAGRRPRDTAAQPAAATPSAPVGPPRAPGLVVLELADGSELRVDRAIVCAGLHADRLARRSGEPGAPRIVPFRGDYWALRPGPAQLVRGLIYPVPDPELPFLGVHLTRTLDGSVLLGPNAVLAPGRDIVDLACYGGTRRLLRRHWRTGVGELRRSLSKAAFVAQARRYVPELRTEDAVRARAGVRAQAVDPDGSLVDDFRIGGDARVAWIRNAPSPAATSALAIAEEIARRVGLG